MKPHNEISGDIPAGRVTFPRHVPFALALTVAATLLSAALGVGGWAWALQSTQESHEQRLDDVDRRWATVQAYMCMECTLKRDKTECLRICGGEE